MSKAKGKVPVLRFQGFEGDWEDKKLLNVADINPAGELPEKFFYIDLESVKDGLLINHNPISKKTAPSRAQRVLRSGDVLYQLVRPYQKNNFYFDLNGDYVASTGYAVLRPNIMNGRYLYVYFHTYLFTKIALQRSTGTSYPALSSGDFSTIKINFPSLPEQEKIAKFFSLLDDKIETHKKLVEQWELKKKGYMQKIFSQELRFLDDNGQPYPEWEEKKLGDVAEISYGYTPPRNTAENFGGQYTWYSVADLSEKYMSTSSETLSEKSYRSDKEIAPNTLLMSFKLTLGRVAITTDYCFTNEAIANFTWKSDNILTEYMYYHLQSLPIEKYGNRAAQGITLNSASLNSIEICLPNQAEQQKISFLLSVTDNRIEIEKQTVEHWQQVKKGYMQQMFV